MDLTTRRVDMLEGTGDVLSLNGTEQVCRELVNGTDSGCDVNTVTPEVTTTTRKTSSFSIRNLVGTGDSDRPSNNTPTPSDGKWSIFSSFFMRI